METPPPPTRLPLLDNALGHDPIAVCFFVRCRETEVITKGVSSLEESLECLNSLENCRILL